MDDSTKTRSELLEELTSLRLQVERWKNIAQKRKEMVEESEAAFLQLTEDNEEVFWMRIFGVKEQQFVSRSYERIWGRSRKELYSDPRRTFIESIHPDDRLGVEQWLVHCAEPIQYRIIRPDGGVRWISDRRFFLYDEQGAVRKIIGIALDLTSMREKFIMFQQAAKAAALERMITFVAHEVRNPLQVIRGGVESLEREKRDDKKENGILQELHYGVTAVDDVINKIILYALPIHPNVSEVTIQELIEAALTKVKTRLENIIIHRKVSCPNKRVQVDKEKIIWALSNIFANAVEAMPEGGEMWVRATCTLKRTAFVISDTGQGISPENQAQVTEPFFTTKPDGIGLGLSISRKIIEAHLGSMKITSRQGQGTTVVILLPFNE